MERKKAWKRGILGQAQSRRRLRQAESSFAVLYWTAPDGHMEVGARFSEEVERSASQHSS